MSYFFIISFKIHTYINLSFIFNSFVIGEENIPTSQNFPKYIFEAEMLFSQVIANSCFEFSLPSIQEQILKKQKQKQK